MAHCFRTQHVNSVRWGQTEVCPHLLLFRAQEKGAGNPAPFGVLPFLVLLPVHVGAAEDGLAVVAGFLVAAVAINFVRHLISGSYQLESLSVEIAP